MELTIISTKMGIKIKQNNLSVALCKLLTDADILVIDIILLIFDDQYKMTIIKEGMKMIQNIKS